ncbi:hypothetical protein BZG35_06550 [Brevundimonas sp. LM2]|uniref:hypothetical protein n=1 Tax=Brevundimonas sp. LM2 TaxID=1938605 RepID=UPI000983AE9C|nr:hypothetical protein [Brevundimonas sp. LM2]AQR61349.1 hypothetical protein BZG35_06550 [Brevundimonas sp. LM2]
MDGNAHAGGSLPGSGFKEVRRRVIDLDAPGVREEIAAAVDRINASEEEAFIMAEMELNTIEVWNMIPE